MSRRRERTISLSRRYKLSMLLVVLLSASMYIGGPFLPNSNDMTPVEVFLFISWFTVPLIMGSLCLLIHAMNWKIVLKKDEFIFTNTFGRKRNYKYCEVKYEMTKTGIILYAGEKRILNQITSINYFLDFQNNWKALKTKIDNAYFDNIRIIKSQAFSSKEFALLKSKTGFRNLMKTVGTIELRFTASQPNDLKSEIVNTMFGDYVVVKTPNLVAITPSKAILKHCREDSLTPMFSSIALLFFEENVHELVDKLSKRLKKHNENKELVREMEVIVSKLLEYTIVNKVVDDGSDEIDYWGCFSEIDLDDDYS